MPTPMKVKPKYTSTGIGCPRCKKGFIQKVELAFNRGTFYGCSEFPRCKYSLSETRFDNQAYLEEAGPRFPYSSFTPRPLNFGTNKKIKLIEGTEEQQVVWSHILAGYDVIVDALAGVGKTTTIIQAIARLPKYDSQGKPCRYIVLAYNSKFVKEITPKLPSNAIAMTVHQLGWRAVQEHFGKLGSPNNFKYEEMLCDEWNIQQRDDKSDDPANNRMLRMAVDAASDLVSLCMTNALDEPSSVDLYWLSSYYNIEVNDSGTVESMVKWVMQNCWKEKYIRMYGVSFDEQVWLPVRLDLPVLQAYAVFADEAQDLSRIRQELLIKVSSRQIVCVGDSRQAIYKFAGADARSMLTLRTMLPSAVELPLTINWRCPSKIIQLAQILVPQIQAKPNAALGKIYEINKDQSENLVKPGNMVLCRTNAPLVAEAFKYIRNGIPVVIVGKDIGQACAKLIDRLATKDKKTQARLKKDRTYVSITRFIERLRKYQKSEAAKLSARMWNSEHLLQLLNDKVETIIALTEDVSSVKQLLQRIEELFKDVDDATGSRVILSTVHKAKGLECPVVFVLESHKLPHPMAQSDEDIEQELNLVYIAITRVLDVLEGGILYFVGGVPPFIRDRALHLVDVLTEDTLAAA